MSSSVAETSTVKHIATLIITLIIPRDLDNEALSLFVIPESMCVLQLLPVRHLTHGKDYVC